MADNGYFEGSWQAKRACVAGSHRWTAWGLFYPAKPKWMATGDRGEPSSEYVPVEAYRWRRCECGAGERETWATGERKLFPRDSDTHRMAETEGLGAKPE